MDRHVDAAGVDGVADIVDSRAAVRQFAGQRVLCGHDDTRQQTFRIVVVAGLVVLGLPVGVVIAWPGGYLRAGKLLIPS